MMTIRWTTWVNAPVERCFLLATNVDLATRQAATRARKGARLQPGDAISWQLGRRAYQSRIDAIRPYSYFRELMTEGIFEYYEHDHHFARMDDGTRMRDEIRFQARFGPLGRLLAATFLRMMLRKRVERQSRIVKEIAESEEWRRYVGEGDGMAAEKITVAEPAVRAANMQRFA